MKELKGKSPYGDYEETIAYLLEGPEDILKVIGLNSGCAGLDHIADQYILDNKLLEHGKRPTAFPAIVVIDANEEYFSLEATYITTDMFEL